MNNVPVLMFLLNFSTMAPNKWKRGLILCLLNRAKTICFSESVFSKEVAKLCSIFDSNGYPINYFDKTLEKFCQANNNKTHNENSNVNNSVHVDDSDNNLRRKWSCVLKISLIGEASYEYQTKLFLYLKKS